MKRRSLSQPRPVSASSMRRLEDLILEEMLCSSSRFLIIPFIHCFFEIFYLKRRHSNGPFQDCSLQNAREVRNLQNACSANDKNFDSWVQDYTTSGDLYNRFQPCSGSLLNEERTKMVIKFCYCYNFCGAGQTRDGCEVEGLEGRLDRNANLFSSYKAMYVDSLLLFHVSRFFVIFLG